MKEPSGGVVSGARVALTIEGTNVLRSAVSDPNGSYEFRALALGRYQLQVSARLVSRSMFKSTKNSPDFSIQAIGGRI